MQGQEAAVHDIVGCLYEAVATPEQWPDALDRLTRLFGSTAAHFFLWDEAADRAVASFGSTTYLGQQDALNHYLRIDPRRLLLAPRPAGSVMLCHEHLDDAFVRTNEFFQDYSLPLGRRYLMAAKLLQSGPTASILAVLRSPGQGPFGLREQALLGYLRPHLERVARQHRQLQQTERKRQVQRDLLDGVACALIATDATASLVELNRAAEVLLSAGVGLRLVSGRIVAWDSGQTDALHRLIGRAVRPKPAAGGLIVDGPGGERLGLMVSAIGSPQVVPPVVPVGGQALDAGRALAMLAVNSLNPRPQPSHYFIDSFRLTPSEARLTTDIASGQRLQDIANNRGVGMPTLRTQLQAIYDKTGIHRQADLVRLVGSLPRVFGSSTGSITG